jgi:peroxiredoxin
MPRLPVAPSAVHPILVGTRVPDVALMAADGSPVELAAALSGKPTVLVFYRGGW